MIRILSLAALGMVAALSAHADERQWPTNATLVNLSEQATRKVAQDRISATMRMEANGSTARLVQDRINGQMQKAVTLAKSNRALKVTTGSYNVYTTRQEEPKGSKKYVDEWRGSQTIIIDSDNPSELLEVAGKIQELGFAMNGLNFYLSEERTASLNQELMLEAIGRLNAKADAIAKALGKKRVHLAQLSTEGYIPQPMPVMYRSMAMKASVEMMDMAAPVAEGGEDTVRVSVSAMAVLQD